jgi:hypothetical protein
LRSHDLSLEAPTPQQLLEDGYCDPIRLFIKNEPHKESKLQEGFLRFIGNMSLVDELIDRLLFAEQNDIEIDNWQAIPSKPGIGFTDEMIQLVHDQVMLEKITKALAEGDYSSWDWTTQGWELMADAEMRVKLYKLNPDGEAARLIRNRFYCVAHSVFVLSNGDMYAQLIPGIMISGWYNTSSTNSRVVKLNSVLAGANWCIAMGDDFLAEDVKGFKETVEGHGHLLKVFKPVGTTFEFCSTEYPSGSPTNVWKMFVKLLSHENGIFDRQLLFVQWLDDMRNSPHREALIPLIEGSGFLDD